MADNRKKQQSLSNSANFSSTGSRQATGSADNPPITLSRENSFCEDKKGNLDNVLANTLSVIMKESKAHRRPAERAHPAPPALNRENAFREDKKGNLNNARANTFSKAMYKSKAHRRPAERAHHAPPALSRENAFCENRKGNFDNTLISTLSELMEGIKSTPRTSCKRKPHPSLALNWEEASRKEQDTKKPTSTGREI